MDTIMDDYYYSIVVIILQSFLQPSPELLAPFKRKSKNNQKKLYIYMKWIADCWSAWLVEHLDWKSVVWIEIDHLQCCAYNVGAVQDPSQSLLQSCLSLERQAQLFFSPEYSLKGWSIILQPLHYWRKLCFKKNSVQTSINYYSFLLRGSISLKFTAHYLQGLISFRVAKLINTAIKK